MVGGWRGRNDSIVQDKEAQVDMSGRFGIFCASDGRGPLRVLVDDQHRSGQKSINKRKTGTVVVLRSRHCVPGSVRKTIETVVSWIKKRQIDTFLHNLSFLS